VRARAKGPRISNEALLAWSKAPGESMAARPTAARLLRPRGSRPRVPRNVGDGGTFSRHTLQSGPGAQRLPAALFGQVGQNLMRMPAVGEMSWVAGKPLARPP
jgi:hypothetical protein